MEEGSVKTLANTTFEISIGRHKYLFVCDSGAEISEVYYALTTIRTKIFELIKKNEEFLEKEQTHPNVTEKEPETIV